MFSSHLCPPTPLEWVFEDALYVSSHALSLLHKQKPAAGSFKFGG